LLDRASQLLRPCLQLAEQARVLDGDHRLVGEGLEERDLVAGEPAKLDAGHRNRPDGFVVPEHRYHHHASKATDTRVGVLDIGQSGIDASVGDIERRSITNGLAVHPLGVERMGEARPHGGVARLVDARLRRELDLITRDSGQRAREPPQQAHRAGHDPLEHRLDVGLRAADGAQDVAGSGLRI
jgi:hypothetical protein